MATATVETQSDQGRFSAWMDWVDDKCTYLGDKFNPILVKETRQALKSRQFVVTFSVLLFAALGWTIVGSLMLMPQIYTTPSAARMMVGYYVVLAIPLLLVVPLAAYRSLEGEIDDGTLELLSITALSPWQIVLGKLASASLQMVLYFVALFPCMAYAYTLRGVDLPTTLMVIGILIVSALFLTSVGLFFAPIARARTGRIITLLGFIMILGGAEWFIGFLVISMIQMGNPMPLSYTVFAVFSSVLLTLAFGNLLLCSTAAQLTPESENRSTPLRLSLLGVTVSVVGVTTYAVMLMSEARGTFELIFSAAIVLTVLWTLCSSMFVAESSVMTPRIQRELPSNFLSRMSFTWLTPGPGTGLVFSVASMVVISVLMVVGIDFWRDSNPVFGNSFRIADRDIFVQLVILYVSYLICFLVCVRWIVAVLRIKNNPRSEIGFAALVAVAVIAALVPYSIELYFSDFRDIFYSKYQITNWAWTMMECMDQNLRNGEEYSVACAAVCMFVGSLLTMPSTVLPRRIATPERVRMEREKK